MQIRALIHNSVIPTPTPSEMRVCRRRLTESISAPVAGGSPDVLDHMTWTGLNNGFGAQTRTMTGGSNNLGQSFIYGVGAEPRNVIIKGLKPNTTYVATIYGVGWENGQRSADFSGSAGGITSKRKSGRLRRY